MPLAPGIRFGPYEVIAQIGVGGMGEVWRATDTNLGRQVAIKVLPDAFAQDRERLARFEREAKTLATLNHSNIAQIYGLERLDGTTALVMELVEGPTLADRIATGRIPVDEALSIAKQIAEALEAAHEQGIVHRDLKPANVKVRDDGTVKVLDFGLAKAMEPPEGLADISHSPTITSPAMTAKGMILGTAAYMSPEQARGKPVDKRTDIWAFGCVVFEMLSGRRAFDGEDVSLALSQVLQRVPDTTLLPADTPPHVRHLLARCLDKDPKRRLRDIGEARLILAGNGSSTLDDGKGFSRIGTVRRRDLWWTAALVLTAIVTATTVWRLRPLADLSGGFVARLVVALPTGKRVAGSTGGLAYAWQPLALSPDGSLLAYSSSDGLYLRPMNGETRGFPGTEGAMAPFFSPDGLWIGFFAQGKLKKIPAAGGAVDTICDAPVPAGGTWAPDNLIYFAPNNASGLMKVPAEPASKPEAATTLDRDAGEVSHRDPHILPNGAGLVVSVWRGPGWDEMDIKLFDVTTGRNRVLVRGSAPTYVTTGHLIYSRAEELMAIGFDLDRLETRGAAMSMGVQVRVGETTHYAVSRDGRVLAYLPGGALAKRGLAWIGRDGRIIDTVPVPPGAYESAYLSPDGRRAALTVFGPTATIWQLDLTGPSLTNLTPNAAGSSQWAVWNSTGNRVIYRATRQGFRNLYSAPADSSGSEQPLTKGGVIQTPQSVSPDGKWLVFTEVDATTGIDLMVLDLIGSTPPSTLLKTPNREENPRIAPNGRWLAYESNSSGETDIYVTTFPMPGPTVRVSTQGGRFPRWSGNSQELFYTNGPAMMVASISGGSVPVVETRRHLFTASHDILPTDVSPDGQRFLQIQLNEPPNAGAQIEVVLNWQEELKRLVPVN
jgi:Tol biopolymer transport system component